MNQKLQRMAGVVLAATVTASALSVPALAASSFTYVYPGEAMQVDTTTLTTLTQRAASEIPLIFGINVVGGNMFDGLRDVGGTLVNKNPDPYIWNYNYITNTDGATLPDDQVYAVLGDGVSNPNGLYQSGGANQTFSEVIDTLGGVGYAVGYRSDIIIGFNSDIVGQIDLVNSWVEGDEYYRAGDETYNPLIIDVQTGSVTSRLYAWAEMGQAISAYMEKHPGTSVRYDDPYTTAVNLEEFSAGIPYYIASLIADGTVQKKTAAFVSAIDGLTLTCSDPAKAGNVSADVYAEVNNFNFLTGNYTVQTLMDAGVDVIMLAATGYSYTATVGVGNNTSVSSDKSAILYALVDAGYTADQMPLVMDASTISVKVGTNGYNYAPTTCMFLPYVQAYAYMDALSTANPAINPAAMVQYMLSEFFHVTDASARDVALYYIGDYWTSVSDEYDRVPNLSNYTYDEAAIESAIQAGIRYALSDAAVANNNLLLPAYRTTDTAYLLLTETASTTLPASGHDYITLDVNGTTKYLDLTNLREVEDAKEEETTDTSSAYPETRTTYGAIIDYYNSGAYGYGDDLTQTLQNYADHMVSHPWQPDTSVPNTYGYNIKASGTTTTPTTPATQQSADAVFTDVSSSDWFSSYVDYVYENGIMSGTDATTFAPLATLTRAQIVQVLYNMEGQPTADAALPFTDVASGDWYRAAVNWAYTNSIVSGTGATTFSPNQVADRQTVATILYNYAVFKGYAVDSRADLSVYSDASSIASWASDALAWANQSGIVTGMTETTIVPTGTATRAQMAAMVMRFLETYQ
ncbi:MAG: S-layer homology domain-containing protein [Oscillospiraceae bacterium]|nr:S-layer homology domain-containing protein [Oscillospiraceae bacterium]